MDCPTCFQKIVAPQAPAPDSKFILTGTKLTDKKITRDLGPAQTVVVENKFPAVILTVAILILITAGAGIFVFRGHFLRPAKNSAPAHPTNPNPAAQPKPAAPKPVAPAANDANWNLTLNTNAISDSPVAGRIHGINFIVERAYFSNGTLTLRDGARGPVIFGCTINFGGVQAESLSGQTINVTTNADTAAKVVLHWKTDAASGRDGFDNGYAMRLEFGVLANNHLPGKIYLCTPDDEKSYLLGSFNAEARKPKPKAPPK